MAVENPNTPERLAPSPRMHGLQGRIEMYNPSAIKGSPEDVFDINNKKVVVSKDALGLHEAEFQKVLKSASTNERRTYWDQKEGSPDDHMNTWKNSFVQSITSRGEYFAQPGQVEFFKGLGVDISHMDGAQAQIFYESYFSPSAKRESQTDTFIQVVLKQIQGERGKYDATQLKNHEEGIRCMAMNFGANGAEVVMQKLY